MEFLSGNFLIETFVPNDELIVARTDLKGNIIFTNNKCYDILSKHLFFMCDKRG